jgi:putative ABC transport system permease protein
MWTISLKTLFADRGKLLTALVGVVFSIVLVNIQGGLFIGLLRKASLLVDNCGADIWVGHKGLHNVDFPHDIPRGWVHRIRAIPGVQLAEPYLVGHSTMTLPSGGFEPVLVVGCDRTSLLGNAWNITSGDASAIRQPDAIIIDEYELAKLDHPKIGDVLEIGGKRARVGAFSRGILGFLVTPYCFAEIDNAAGFLNKRSDICSYFLVKAESNADVPAIIQEIRQRIPDVDAYTREEYSRLSISYWMTRTGLGISFGAATLLGLAVGMVIVAQTLYASVLDRLVEFGALKAIGASESQLLRILLSQALVMATAGSATGLGLVYAIIEIFHSPKAPIIVPWWLALGACTLVVLICLIAALLPYLRVRKLDPVMVLQG